MKAESFMWRAGLGVLTLLMMSDGGSARSRHGQGAAGDFDYFLLSLSIAPSFCASSPANQAKDECRSLTEAAFRQTPLTVHGLWPNKTGVSVNRQPEDCQAPLLGVLPAGLQSDLQRYMPGGETLEEHEWRKHGACSGLSPEAYFSALDRLAQQANATVGAALRDGGMLGRRVGITELVTAVAAKDPALAGAMVVDCRMPRGGGPALIEEIRIVLSKDLSPMPVSEVGMRQNSGCPLGQGLIADVGR